MIFDRKAFRSVPQLFRLWPSPSSRVVAVHTFKLIYAFKFILSRFVMAYVAEQLSEELKHILAKGNVAPEMQAHIQGLGLTTVSLFALLGDDRGAVRECLAAPPFDFNPGDTAISATVKLQRRIAQAQIVDAWEAARARTEQNRKVEATQRASQLPITIASGTLVMIRRASGTREAVPAA